jgi:hypothetical protein
MCFLKRTPVTPGEPPRRPDIAAMPMKSATNGPSESIMQSELSIGDFSQSLEACRTTLMAGETLNCAGQTAKVPTFGDSGWRAQKGYFLRLFLRDEFLC